MEDQPKTKCKSRNIDCEEYYFNKFCERFVKSNITSVSEKKECALHESTVELMKSFVENRIARCNKESISEIQRMLENYINKFDETLEKQEDLIEKKIFDHETRIRTVEKKVWKFMGIFLILGVVLQLIIGATLTTVIKTTFKEVMLESASTTPKK